MSVDLSIVLPSIRLNGLVDLLDSIEPSLGTKYTYEVIVASPYDEILKLDRPNLKTIKTFGSPNVGLQLATIEAKGEWIYWGSDDGVFHANALEETLDLANNDSKYYKDVYMLKYTESDNPSPDMYGDQYYKLSNYAGSSGKFIPNDWFGLNCCLMTTKYLHELGGFDCEFQTMIFGLIDLAVRVQRDKVSINVLDKVVAHHGHMPGMSGDHGPICITQHHYDEPLFAKIYNDPACLSRIKISLDNYKLQPEKWEKRFA